VCADIAQQIARGNLAVMGVMIESNLVKGRQDVPAAGRQGLVYGQSITDACVDWDTTVTMLENLAAAVRTRRSLQVSHQTKTKKAC